MENLFINKACVSLQDLKNIYYNLMEWYSRDIAIKQIINDFDKNYLLTSGFNNIYFYMGHYLRTEYEVNISGKQIIGQQFEFTKENENNEILFCELNSRRKVYINSSDELLFKSKNNIIDMSNYKQLETEEEYINNFNRIRKAYLESLIIYNEKYACKNILSNDSINRLLNGDTNVSKKLVLK